MNRQLLPTLRLSVEMTDVLAKIEHAGIKINLDTLQEINLQNARLLYANRVLSDSSLNEQQKSKVAELVANARSVEEAKMV